MSSSYCTVKKHPTIGQHQIEQVRPACWLTSFFVITARENFKIKQTWQNGKNDVN